MGGNIIAALRFRNDFPPPFFDMQLPCLRDKGRGILRKVKQQVHKRYDPNEQYDRLISRLFRDRLHQNDHYSILFARRGQKDRTRAIVKALEQARRRFEEKWKIRRGSHIAISVVPAHQQPCLQAADYLLWAVQRCY